MNTVLNVGIMPREQFQQRVLAIAAGRYTPQQGEPKIWFSSMKSLSEVLSDNNMRLLKMIEEKQPENLTALATFSGSAMSSAFGLPVATLQKAQARVQISPMIMKVACFLSQHSPIFGQPASSQTVTSLCDFTISRVSA